MWKQEQLESGFQRISQEFCSLEGRDEFRAYFVIVTSETDLNLASVVYAKLMSFNMWAACNATLRIFQKIHFSISNF